MRTTVRGRVLCDDLYLIGEPFFFQATQQRSSTHTHTHPRRMVAEPEAEGSFRCWICLEDTETLDGMISPCACVGTNRWVHEDCMQAIQISLSFHAPFSDFARARAHVASCAGLKTYCLQFLASNHSANSPSLQVACPICRKEYKITAQHDSSTASWRELFRWSSTDHQLLCVIRAVALRVEPLPQAACVPCARYPSAPIRTHPNRARVPVQAAARALLLPGDAASVLFTSCVGVARRLLGGSLFSWPRRAPHGGQGGEAPL